MVPFSFQIFNFEKCHEIGNVENLTQLFSTNLTYQKCIMCS